MVGIVWAGTAILMTACGAGSASSTEQGAVDNLHSVLATYNASAQTDVAATGSACSQALSGLHGSSFLTSIPRPGKEFAVRQELHEAYLGLYGGFSDCALGARTMNYGVMARGDSEVTSAIASLEKARSGG